MLKCECFDCGKRWWTMHPTWLCKECREKRLNMWKRKPKKYTEEREMCAVRKCYNANCENNYMGGYCECSEIIIDENGCCTSYFPKSKDEESEDTE